MLTLGELKREIRLEVRHAGLPPTWQRHAERLINRVTRRVARRLHGTGEIPYYNDTVEITPDGNGQAYMPFTARLFHAWKRKSTGEPIALVKWGTLVRARGVLPFGTSDPDVGSSLKVALRATRSNEGKFSAGTVGLTQNSATMSSTDDFTAGGVVAGDVIAVRGAGFTRHLVLSVVGTTSHTLQDPWDLDNETAASFAINPRAKLAQFWPISQDSDVMLVDITRDPLPMYSDSQWPDVPSDEACDAILYGVLLETRQSDNTRIRSDFVARWRDLFEDALASAALGEIGQPHQEDDVVRHAGQEYHDLY